MQPGEWIGPYQVVRELGRGGMGAVLEVRHAEVDRSPTGTALSARMAVLNARGQMQVGDRFSVPVTDGRDRLAYDIRVESESAVAIAGQAVPAFKLRLDAWESDATGKRQVAHRPAYIWLSRDADRSLLRVDVRHAIGRFRAELQAADTRVDVAQLQPRRRVGDRP